jgi:ubiquinone/menaquinone biosynthesis C-methylase UbiE
MIRGATEQTSVWSASYQDIAQEYYDRVQHPTCYSLRQLSEKFITSHMRRGFPASGILAEIGAGLSILAPEAEAVGSLSRVALVDHSPAMLSYSAHWIANGARAVLAEADATGLTASSASLIVSSLGDPYNKPRFWTEVSRVLTPGGVCLFTTPSFEWSSRFRTGEGRNFAEFARRDGARLLMPSYVWDEHEQRAMFEDAGLKVRERQAFGTSMIEGSAAPKLLCVSSSTPVVTAYLVQKEA